MPVVSTAAPRCTASGCNLIHTSDTEESQLGFASLLLGGGNESKNIPCTSLHGCVDLLFACYVKRAWSHLYLFAHSMMREMAVQPLRWWSAQQIHSWSHCAENQWQKCFEVCCGNMLEQNVQKRFLGNWHHVMLCYKHASINVTLKYYCRCLSPMNLVNCRQQKQAQTTRYYCHYYY